MKKLARCVLGVLIVEALIAGAVGLYVMRKGLSAKEPPLAAEVYLARTFRHLAVPSKYRDEKNPISLTPDILSKARAHFADHCASCHGNDGRGQTSMGRNLYPKAPDMALRATQDMSDGEIFYTIKNGVRLTGMPGWGEDTPEDDMASWHLVHFIRHLPKITPEEVAEMESLNPKGPDEWKEIQEEKEFLAGEEAGARKETSRPSAHSH